MGKVKDKILEIFESIIQWMYDVFVEPFTGLPTLKNLVFGKTSDSEELIWKTFTESDLTNGLSPIFYSMVTLAGFFIIAFIVIYGMRIAGATLNPYQRNEVVEFLKDLILVGILLFNLPILYDLIFSVNEAIVNMFSSAFDSEIDERIENRMDSASGILGMIFIQLTLLGLMLWANFYYIMRKLTLILLMGLGPLMVAFWLHPRFKPITAGWIKELIGSVFVQSIHAFVFWTVATISASSDGFIETVILYLIFIPVSESIRRLIGLGGDMQGGFARAGAMLGMSALAGMYGSIKGALEGKSVTGALRGAYQGWKDNKLKKDGSENAVADEAKSTIAASVGTDKGTNLKAEKMLKAGDITSKAGKAVLGMAGSVAGSPLGPMGAILGATGGSALGGAAGGIAGRAAVATAQGLSDRIKKGINAFKEGGLKNNLGFEENLLNEIADRQTASWADNNKNAIMNDLRERFPDASPADLESKFNQIMAQKRKEFYADAKAKFNKAKAFDGNMFSGNQLVNTSAEAMANQWAKDNQAQFFADYDKHNPIQPGESREDYLSRRMNAFLAKKNEMKQAFARKGNEIISQLAVDGSEPINKDDFVERLGNAISNLNGVGNTQSLINASSKALDHVKGVNLFNSSGQPNIPFLASRLAHEKTLEMGNQFIQEQMANGISKDQAEQMWQQRMPQVHRENLKLYSESAKAADALTFSSGIKGFGQRAVDGVVRLKEFASASTGLSGLIENTQKLRTSLKTGYDSAGAAFTVKTDFGQGNLVSHLKGFKNAATEGINTALQTMVEQSGGAVNAHAKLQNAAGYTAGVLFGAKGYQIGKSLISKLSPTAKMVQNAIYTPSEIIQMARTEVDEYGNTRVAQGAIRQVITPNESYIEVQTKTGETKIVSRKGAGHSGLRPGDVIYQDLEVQGDRLVVSTPKGATSSTYRIDSGGGRVPSMIQVDSNPNELLANPRVSNKHRPLQKVELPSFNQLVDSGQFFIEDLQIHGMKNIQVVIEKDRQFVTAQKDGITYRVSPIFAGDTRLAEADSIKIPVAIENSELKPIYAEGSNVAVQSYADSINGDYSTIPNNLNHQYYSSHEIKTLIPSKRIIRAVKSLEKRRLLDEVRRKQGLLG